MLLRGPDLLVLDSSFSLVGFYIFVTVYVFMGIVFVWLIVFWTYIPAYIFVVVLVYFLPTCLGYWYLVIDSVCLLYCGWGILQYYTSGA